MTGSGAGGDGGGAGGDAEISFLGDIPGRQRHGGTSPQQAAEPVSGTLCFKVSAEVLATCVSAECGHFCRRTLFLIAILNLFLYE